MRVCETLRRLASHPSTQASLVLYLIATCVHVHVTTWKDASRQALLNV